MDDRSIADELQRVRQSISLPRPFRDLGPADFSLRPSLFGAVFRYSRGRCMDFAARLATVTGLRLAALHTPNGGLAHAFLVDLPGSEPRRLAPSSRCLDVSGTWSLAEMRRLQRANDGSNLVALLLDEGATLAQMDAEASAGAEFETEEVVLSVAGCLPHLRALVPERFRVEGAREALDRLVSIEGTAWSEPCLPEEHRPGPR